LPSDTCSRNILKFSAHISMRSKFQPAVGACHFSLTTTCITSIIHQQLLYPSHKKIKVLARQDLAVINDQINIV